MTTPLWTPQQIIRTRKYTITSASINFTVTGLSSWEILHGVFGMVTAANVGNRVYTIYICDSAAHTMILLATRTMPASTTNFIYIGSATPSSTDLIGTGSYFVQLHDRGPHMSPGDYFHVAVSGGFAGDAGYVRLRVRETIPGQEPIITST